MNKFKMNMTLIQVRAQQYIYLLSLLIKIMSVAQSRTSQYNPKLNKIIDVEDAKIQYTVKQKVKQKLAEDAQFLLQKKKREDEKKERVKKMEQQFEKQRRNKMKMMNDKQAKSEEVRQKNKEQQDKKFKQKSQQFKKVINKIQHNNVEQIQKALSLQKQLESGKNSKSFSKTSKDTNFNHSGRTQSLRFQYDNVEQKIAQIVSKGNKAQKHHEQQNKIMIQRIRQKTKGIQQVQQRAMNHSLIQQSQKLRNYYEKKEQLEKINSNCKNQSELRILQKRKSVKQKLDRCSENLKHLSYLEQQKFQQLQNKFNKKIQPKKWKDIRLQKYKQKWEENSRRIQIQKQQKAEQILSKHQQISQQNKIYKQQKDKLIQAVKHAS